MSDNSKALDIAKVNKAVKLKMQIIAMTAKWEKLFWELSGDERVEYSKRIAK